MNALVPVNSNADAYRASTDAAEKIARLSTVNAETGCWEATPTTYDGYARYRHRGRMTMMHRVSYEEHRGPIPEGLQIDHLCRIRHCLNPDHMEAVTQHENIRRGVPRCAKVTHCPRGHPYSVENTYRRDGRRHCRKCVCTASAAYRARKSV